MYSPFFRFQKNKILSHRRSVKAIWKNWEEVHKFGWASAAHQVIPDGVLSKNAPRNQLLYSQTAPPTIDRQNFPAMTTLLPCCSMMPKILENEMEESGRVDQWTLECDTLRSTLQCHFVTTCLFRHRWLEIPVKNYKHRASRE